MNVHELTLQNYTAASGCPSACQPILYLGTAGSYGNEQINVVLGEGWQGLTVKAVFHPSGVPVVVPDGGGVISVPWEATQSVVAYPNGRISFQGYVSGRLVNTSDVPYTVGGSSAGTDNTPAPTPDEFQQFVDAVKADADRAEQAAADAKAAVQEVKDAGTQAITDIGNAKDSALEAIDKAREEAAGSISADVEGAKQAAAQAEQSAKDAAATLEKVQSAGQSALDDIATERQNTLSDIQNEGAKQQSAVAGAGTAALEAIGQTEQAAINQIKQTGETQVGAVQSAGTTQISQINSAGAAQVQAVKDEGAAQTSALDDAAAAHKTELEAIASHPPQPNTETGKWQVWNAETGAYQDTDALYQGGYYTASVSDDGTLTWQGSQEGMPELPSVNIKGPKGDKGDPGLGVPSPTQSDAGKVPTVKTDGSTYELAGPYAPLSAAIRPTASGNPVNITDSVEWLLLGLKVYGKSTQVTTTGAQLFDITKATAAAAAFGVNISIEGEEIRLRGTFNTDDGNTRIQFRLVQVPELFPDGSKVSYFDARGTGISKIQNLALPTSIDDPYITIILTAVASGTSVDCRFKIMVSQHIPTSWEPYTGGKPSPSPEYPQPIVNAGDTGSIVLTISDGADRSQSLTLSTPNGLPGIPVTSGGNYIDASGQQWASDVKDLGGKTETQNVLDLTFDGSADENWILQSGVKLGNRFRIVIRPAIMPSHKGSDNSMNNLLPIGINGATSNTPYCYTISYDDSVSQLYIALSGTESLEEFKAYLQENPMRLLARLVIPITTPLSAEELAAYRALHTYDGSTVVSTAEDVAGLEVRYVADAQKYIDDRLAAAESHIQEIAAAQLNAQTGG